MKKIVVLKHQNSMKYSREFFEMAIPKELSITIYLIVSICLIAVGIIIFGRIDEVIKTQGCVRTKVNVSSVSNVIAGQIVELNYLHGQKIKKGDILYKIDPSIYEAQKKMYIREKTELERELKGLESLINSYHYDKNLCDINDSISYSRFDSYLKNIEVLEIKTNIAEKEYIYEEEKPETMKNLYDTEMKLQDYKLSLANLSSYKSEFIEKLNSELKERQIQLFENQQNILKLDNQNLFLDVKSPMDGYVQEIASLNKGDYLEANSKVLNIVPNDSENFRVEIQIPSKDMGKIQIGQKVKYRLSAFPFFEYRGAEGIITSIDPDIRAFSEKGPAYYIVYGDIDRTEFSNSQGEIFPIRAGLETDVRIVLKRKSILYFILKRLDFIN